MKISTLEDHCLRCLSRLARARGRVTIGTIAEAEGLSVENTAKVLARLREAGLIESFRGKEGGYELVRPADEIAIADVLRAVGGELFESERCTGSRELDPCVHETSCDIRPIWTVLSELVNGVLSAITLADLVDDDGAAFAKLQRFRKVLAIPQPLLDQPPRGDEGGALPQSLMPAGPAAGPKD